MYKLIIPLNPIHTKANSYEENLEASASLLFPIREPSIELSTRFRGQPNQLYLLWSAPGKTSTRDWNSVSNQCGVQRRLAMIAESQKATLLGAGQLPPQASRYGQYENLAKSTQRLYDRQGFTESSRAWLKRLSSTPMHCIKWKKGG